MAELLKYQLAEKEIDQLVDLLLTAGHEFEQKQFKQQALTDLDELELKQRVQHLIHVLQQHLPTEFEQAAAILLAVTTDIVDDSWGSFTAWPLIDYVAEAGMSYPELALKVLQHLTPLFSAEFAIRPFIEQHFEITHTEMLGWTKNRNPHVRRLASEGIRPRLPWGKRLQRFCDDPEPIFPILKQLRNDDSLYVRKSVANNLNDIAKDNPERVIQECIQWLDNATAHTQWIIRHGLRSLIKAGHPDVFSLLGYTDSPQVRLSKLALDKRDIKVGESLSIELGLQSAAAELQTMVLDYKVHFVKANGQLSSKVFKWKDVNLAASQTITLTKSHSFKEISTRKYYAGEHKLEVMINGQSLGHCPFYLTL
jgi:3-methyladenine DNA glycosylase AlkC